MHELASFIRIDGSTVFQESGLARHMQLVMAEAHSATWHTIQGAEQLTRVVLGTRAGDPLGSTAFNYMAVKVLSECEQALLDAGLACVLPPTSLDLGPWHDGGDELAVTDVTYADDSVFPGPFLDAEECAPKAAQCATTVLGVYARHQLRLNPKADKSEFMIILRGPGAKRAAADIAFQDDSVVTAFLYEQEVKFRVVKEYQHMGSVLEAGRRMLPEIIHRATA